MSLLLSVRRSKARAYQSRDADFVFAHDADRDSVDSAMLVIGFRARANGEYEHPATGFTVDFPRGLLMIGVEHIRTWSTVKRGNQILHVLTPTDALRDRFLHFYAYQDLSAFRTALDIGRAMRSRIDIAAFESWGRLEASNDRAYDVRGLERFLADLAR